MANNRTDASPMNGHRLSLFVCGAVLGGCLGFAAGHVLVWGRLPPNSAPPLDDWLSAEIDRRQFDGSAPKDAHAFDHRGPSAASDSVTGPFYASAVRRPGSDRPAVDDTGRETRVRVAAETSTTTAAPDALSRSLPAEPINEQTLYREQVTRSIISQEMPHATPQEQDVWFDVLRGLEAADVKGILRMRKHVGGGSRTMPGTAGSGRSTLASRPTEGSPGAATAPVRPEWVDALACLQELRDIRLHNQMNADTIGYRRRLPIVSEAGPDALGVRLAGVRHDMDPGEARHTGNPLDVMIDGIGFLKVSRTDEVRLTRSGRLALDEERFLVLGTTAVPWRLDPPVQVPDEIVSLTISTDGIVSAMTAGQDTNREIGAIRLVTVFNPNALRHTGGGLFEVTAASGAAQPAGAIVRLRQHVVECMSAEDLRDEYNAVKRVERLIEEILASQDAFGRVDARPERD